MRIVNSILTIFIFSFAIIVKGEVNANYNSANQLYADGKYEEAITAYEAIINSDYLSSDIYYNLGNAYYKTNHITAAILYYERALKLQPDNEDAIYNLNMANKQTIDKIERLPELFIENSWRNLITSRTVSGWTYYCIGLTFLSLLFFIGYLLLSPVLMKKINFYSGLFFLSLSLFCLILASQHNTIIKESSEAIIFSPTITIQSEPNINSEKLFTLHEGTKVKLLEESKGWNKIKLPNGNVGWLKSEALKNI
jgi:tetratricopeptide (TPR) repeat protein